MNITVNISTLDTAVRRQLAIIAKRTPSTVPAGSASGSAAGIPTFSDIAPSSSEMEAIHDFYTDAVLLLNTTSQHFVTAATTPAESAAGATAAGAITLIFPTNHNDAMNTTISVAFTTFLVAYAVYAWLSVTSPALIERYKQAMADKLNALIQLIFYKRPPQSGYTDNLPPVISLPGDNITLIAGEQRLIAYVLGSDNTDDLQITSSVPASVSVSKNTSDRLFSIINTRTPNDTEGTGNVTATVTITKQGVTLGSITVTALPATVSPSASDPVIIGYNPVSDSLRIPVSQTVTIGYLGVITSATASNDLITVSVTVPAGSISGSAAGILTITAGATEGTSTVTLYAANGWRYTLYVTVAAAQSTSPVINVVSPIAFATGTTHDILYTLGSDGIDDLIATVVSISDALTTPPFTIVKDTTNHKFVLTGTFAGSANVAITSAAHPEANKFFLAVVTSAVPTAYLPDVYGYASGDTLNTIAGADDIHIDYFPGSTGTMEVTSSDTSIIDIWQDTDNDFVVATPLATGNATLTFTNAAMNWSLVLNVAVAARPAVITPPVIYWPDGLTLNENGDSVEVFYEPSNDGSLDNVLMTSSDTSKLTIVKNETNHKFTLTPHAKGSVVVTVTDNSHGLNETHSVEVLWVAPLVLEQTHTLSVFVNDTYNIYFREASSGITACSVTPTGKITAAIQTTSWTVGGITYNKKVVVSGVEAGTATLLMTNGQWSSQFTFEVENAETEEAYEPVITSYQVQGSSAVPISAGTTSLSVTTPGVHVYVDYTPGQDLWGRSTAPHPVSSNASIAEVSVSSGRVVIMPRAVGSAYIYFYNSQNSTMLTISLTVSQSQQTTTPVVLSYTIGSGSPVSTVGLTSVSISSRDTIYLNIDESEAQIDDTNITITNTSVAEVDYFSAGRGASGAWRITILAEGTTDIVLHTASDPNWSFTIRLTVPAETQTPYVVGSTARTISSSSSAQTDTITIANGTISSVDVSSSPSGLLTAGNGTTTTKQITIAANGTGTGTVTIHTTAGVNLTVTYTISGSSSLPEWDESAYVSGEDEELYLKGTLSYVDGGVTISVANPVFFYAENQGVSEIHIATVTENNVEYFACYNEYTHTIAAGAALTNTMKNKLDAAILNAVALRHGITASALTAWDISIGSGLTAYVQILPFNGIGYVGYTVSGVTNPVFWLEKGQVILNAQMNSGEPYWGVYDSSEGHIVRSNVTFNTTSRDAVFSEIVQIMQNTYGLPAPTLGDASTATLTSVPDFYID